MFLLLFSHLVNKRGIQNPETKIWDTKKKTKTIVLCMCVYLIPLRSFEIKNNLQTSLCCVCESLINF
jgi:hypothetical protein